MYVKKLAIRVPGYIKVFWIEIAGGLKLYKSFHTHKQ